jgi:hypothetical protein
LLLLLLLLLLLAVVVVVVVVLLLLLFVSSPPLKKLIHCHGAAGTSTLVMPVDNSSKHGRYTRRTFAEVAVHY